MKLKRTPEAIAATLSAADLAYARRDRLITAGLRQSDEADARALAHVIEMENRHG